MRIGESNVIDLEGSRARRDETLMVVAPTGRVATILAEGRLREKVIARSAHLSMGRDRKPS